ncbi:9012_t:CDS:10 [Diversispora eburnea]|uniref:9012_t:CDS:1 n=1 Tax=Diversispora eburnea TaxID=1213867 RepID=A0A9N8YLC4_9GLOM|nr:9012_t:CDS:10 [Diversispora eburnea]
MISRRSSELDTSPPFPSRAPTPIGTNGGDHNKGKKSREEKDSFFSKFRSTSRPASPGPGGNSLSLPEGEELRRKSFDSAQPDMNVRYGNFPPPPEIAPFFYQSVDLNSDNGKGSSAASSSNSHARSFINKRSHRRTKSSDSDSALDSSSKDKDSAPPEVIYRKNSDTESFSFPNLIITPTQEKDDPFVNLKKEKSWRKKPFDFRKLIPSNKLTSCKFPVVDTNLDDMNGIINRRNHRLSGETYAIPPYMVDDFLGNDMEWPPFPLTSGSEMWSPPDSWAVIKPTKEPTILPEEENIPTGIENEKWEGEKKNFCIRIFRPDATFGTVNCILSATTAELFEQAGYTGNDNIEDVGREDNSYLVRFTFRETLEEGTLSTFQHVDLQARNLQTIPIFLYRHAYYIRSLNVSKNLMLDLPTDFIQSCTQLRELHLSNNKLEHVPQSVRHAEMLSLLNLNSNSLKDLDHIALETVGELSELSVENNLLQSLPENYSQFKTLSILNLANNSFTQFPLVVCNIQTLKELDLSYNKITSVIKEIGQLINLRRLFLIGNQITDKLPESFQHLIYLEILDIRRNQITNIDSLSLVQNLKVLKAEYNNITTVDLSSSKLQKLILCKNHLTQFSLKGTGGSLEKLSLANSKLTTLPDDLFEHLLFVHKVRFCHNQLTSIPMTIKSMINLTHFSCTSNVLSSLPSEIGSLKSLCVLDIHNNNLKSLPKEIWLCENLVTLNVSSNLLDEFPSPPDNIQAGSSPSSRTRTQAPLVYSLKTLLLGDNRLTADIFPAVSRFTELKVLNLSFNELDEIPTGGVANPHLSELYLSGNQLSSLPDDIEKLTNLKILHLNGNKLQTLPAELSKIKNLSALDVGSNLLKYNIANWQYDWNWNWNFHLKYLNLSGNKRFEIKLVPQHELNPPRGRILTDFSALRFLRVLGLMDITLLNLTVPDESDNRRVRTSGSEVNSISYGMADTLGKSENLSTWESVTPKFRERDDECLFGLFDARKGFVQGGQVTKFLHDLFPSHFKLELEKLKEYSKPRENDRQKENEFVESALRRSFLSLNKELGTKVFNSSLDGDVYTRDSENLNPTSAGINDCKSGASGIVAYISGTTLYIANVGDTVAVISRGGGSALTIAKCPDISAEVERIRQANGFISHDGLVNGEVDVSRSFGHFHLMPIINGNPIIEVVNLSEQDEFLILATRGLWDCMSPQTAVDIARTEKEDLMLAAQKLRDFAISYGADKNITVMIIGVGDLFDRNIRKKLTGRDKGKGLDEAGTITLFGYSKKRLRIYEMPSDSTMARLEKEIAPPTGQIALVFTDIKNSTFLWETIPVAMRHAIKQHNTIMRRQLRNIGGYEVKTEGDAFMVSFPTVAAALLWCFTVQLELLKVDWPQEVIDSDDGKEVYSITENELIYKGLSVRMGIHCGEPVWETDIVTGRMDYFGPMVNRAARICNAADGGQICVSSDVESEIRLLDEDNEASSRKNSTGGDDDSQEMMFPEYVIDKNITALKKMGFVVKKIGERKLKGLENAEVLSLVYPEKLKGRLEADEVKARNSVAAPQTIEPSSQILDPFDIRSLGYLCLRLERVSSGYVSQRSSRNSRTDYLTGLLTFHVKDNADDEELLRIFESLITRIENVVARLILKKVEKFAGVIEQVGDAVLMDPDNILRALQMYTQLSHNH